MEIARLEQAIIDLNDGEEIERSTTFISAANLALNHLGRVLPRIGYYALYHIAPLLTASGPVDTERLYAAGSAYSAVLSVEGSGKLLGDGAVIQNWNVAERTTLKVMFEERVSVLSFADVTGGVYDLAAFGKISNEANLPEYDGTFSYDIAELCPDFASFDAISRRDNRTVKYDIEGSRIRLYRDSFGMVRIKYRRRPPVLTLDDIAHTGASIDIEPEQEDLLTLIMSYYIWLEDEPKKADKFLNMFASQLSLAQGSAMPGIGRTTSINNW